MAARSLCNIAVMLAAVGPAMAQQSWTVRFGGGLGVGLASMPALSDYVNVVTSPSPDRRMEEFTSVAELVLSAAVRVDNVWSVGLEYSRLVKSVQPNEATGTEMTADVTMPMVSLRRVFIEEGAIVEGSVSGGWYSGVLTEWYPSVGGKNTFEGRGPGLLLQASAYTPFDNNFYGTIEAGFRWSFVKKLRNGAGRSPTYGGATADLQFFVLELKFGMFYQI